MCSLCLCVLKKMRLCVFIRKPYISELIFHLTKNSQIQKNGGFGTKLTSIRQGAVAFFLKFANSTIHSKKY